ncbi:MAG: ATP-binding protein [Verrucomicrobiota bacterium]
MNPSFFEEENQSTFRFRVLNPSYNLDALLFWSLYCSTSVLILWLLISQAKDVVRYSTASHLISLSSTTASALSESTNVDNEQNIAVLNAAVRANRDLIATAGVYELAPDGKLLPRLLQDSSTNASQITRVDDISLIESAVNSGVPTFSRWNFFHSRELPVFNRAANRHEYSFTRIRAGNEESGPLLLAITFNAPKIQERFLQVDEIGAVMVGLSILVATCLGFAIRFRSIQRVKATHDKVKAVNLVTKRGAILNAVARAADKLLNQKNIENVLNDLLVEIKPRMEVKFIYATLAPGADGALITAGAPSKLNPVRLSDIQETESLARWSESLDQNDSIVTNLETALEGESKWMKKRKVTSIAMIPIRRDKKLCGLLVSESSDRDAELDSGLIDLLKVIADLFTSALTQRSQNEKMMQASKVEALGRMAGGVAHEFNNLLHIISGNLRSLKPTDELNKEMTHKILGASERGSEIVEQLLRATHLRETDLQPCSLNAVVENTIELAKRTLGDSVQIEHSLDTDLPGIMANPGQLQQVLLNLLINARDAMGGTGQIQVLSFVEDNKVICEVRDQGSGINEGHLDELFDPFFTTKDPGKGTGLGLSTSRGILEEHGGSISARNLPGKGAAFTLAFPIKSMPEMSAHPSLVFDEQLAPEGYCILIADDEDACLEVTRDILEEKNYCVYAATNGEEALQIAREHASHIGWVLSDWTMPGLHGPELIQKYRELLPEASIIVTSGYLIKEDEVVEMDGFVQKPFSPETLFEAMAALPPRKKVSL